MHWKPLVIAACFAVTTIGCAVDTDDDTPDVNITHEERVAPPPAPDQPDVDIDVDANTHPAPPTDDTDVDVDIDARRPAPEQPDSAPSDSPNQPPG